jgi:hypothetical protein
MFFMDSSRKEHISIEPVINGLSDHDAQLLVIKNIELISNYHNYRKLTSITTHNYELIQIGYLK